MELTHWWCACCEWFLPIAHTLNGETYCMTCAPHAHLLTGRQEP